MKLTCEIHWHSAEDQKPDACETVLVFAPKASEPILLGWWDSEKEIWWEVGRYKVVPVEWWASMSDMACPEK